LLPECVAYETSEITFGIIDTCTLYNDVYNKTTALMKNKRGFQACYEQESDAMEEKFNINKMASNPLVMLVMNFVLFPILLCALLYLLYFRSDDDEEDEEENKGIAMNAMEVLELNRKKWMEDEESSSIESNLIPQFRVSYAKSKMLKDGLLFGTDGATTKGGVMRVGEQIEGIPEPRSSDAVGLYRDANDPLLDLARETRRSIRDNEVTNIASNVYFDDGDNDALEMQELRRSIRDKKPPNQENNLNRRPSKRKADISPGRRDSRINPAVNKRFYMARSVSVTSDVSNDKFSVPSVLLRESHFVSSDELGTASLCGPECAICSSVFLVNEAVTTLPCNHDFHTLCLIPWLRQKPTCPLCRYVLKPLE